MKSLALVTGATGLIGSHIVETLRAAGVRVRALVRPTSDTSFLAGLGVELARGDVRDRAAVQGACAGADVVYHAAAQLGEWAPRSHFVDLNVTAVGTLVEAAAAARVRRVVHLSSVAVYGRERRPAITEDTPYRPTGHPYMDTKAEGERIAFEAGRRHGVEVVAVRPCLVYGPRDRSFLPHMIRNLRRGRMLIIGSGRHRANTVYAGTVADLCVALRAHDGVDGESFNVADPDPLTWRELVTAVAMRVGCRPPHMTVPAPLAYAVGGMMEVAARAIGSPKPPPMTRFVAGALGYDLGYSTRKAEQRVGFRPRVTVREGLDRSIGLPEPAAVEA